MGQSLLDKAIKTPVEKLTEEQKALLRDNIAALSAADAEKFESILTPQNN